MFKSYMDNFVSNTELLFKLLFDLNYLNQIQPGTIFHRLSDKRDYQHNFGRTI